MKKFKKSIIILDDVSEKYLTQLKIEESTKFLNISEIKKYSQQKIEKTLKNSCVIIGFGSGKTIDFTKLLAYKYKKHYITIPIYLSSDVAFTPTISIKFKKSVKTVYYKLPLLVLISRKIIFSSSPETLKAGVCDAIAKFIALKDWEIAEKYINEKNS